MLPSVTKRQSMHFPKADNFYILLPIHSPKIVLNKNGGPVQSIFKDKSQTVLKWALAVRQNCFFQVFYTVGSVVNCDPVETLSITVNRCKFAKIIKICKQK